MHLLVVAISIIIIIIIISSSSSSIRAPGEVAEVPECGLVPHLVRAGVADDLSNAIIV